MRPFAGSPRKCGFLSTFVFTALLMMAGSLLKPNAAAQDTGGAARTPPEPPPAPAVFQNPIPGAQLVFLNDFAGQPVKVLLKDKRFRSLMKAAVPRTEYHYGRDMPLSDAIDMVLDGSKEPVEVREGRYALVSGRSGPYLRGRGFVWFDLQQRIVLGGFYFQPTNGEPTPTLTVFSRQLNVDSLSMTQLPLAFAGDLIQWATQAGVPPVEPRYFIPDNGKKYVLIHDEEYCDHPEDQPPPPQERCQQLNADAADADVNAAYFMSETHNQANATAWMLGADQVAWIGMREQTCGAGLACRIRITRERTRVLMGGGRRR
ncbi:MAG: lysozyme inhibitor LprI family protein [Terracidiphilus sp.]|jgi:uncharacterized protein YecT (DUF1311 family)